MLGMRLARWFIDDERSRAPLRRNHCQDVYHDWAKLQVVGRDGGGLKRSLLPAGLLIYG
jgi:hypothetical protein